LDLDHVEAEVEVEVDVQVQEGCSATPAVRVNLGVAIRPRWYTRLDAPSP
jgi:hypothetical protein